MSGVVRRPQDIQNATILEIANRAGVSPATVSRVINKTRKVRSELADRVVKAARELNFKPSAAARFMRGRTTGIVGMVLPQVSHPFFGELSAGAIARARDYDQVVVLSSAEGARDTEKQVIDQLSRSVLDGLIYCPVATGDPLPQVEAFHQLPVVVAGRRAVFPDRPHVYTDNRAAGYQATRYLLKLNRRNIGFVAGFWDAPCSRDTILEILDDVRAGAFSTLDRLYGHLCALRESGIELQREYIVITGYDAPAGYSAAQQLTSSLLPLDALLVPNANVAEGALRFFREQAIRVPQEVSILSYDDGGLAGMLATPVTAIQHNMRRVGSVAVDLLNSLIAGEKPENVVIDVHLVIRQSTNRRE